MIKDMDLKADVRASRRRAEEREEIEYREPVKEKEEPEHESPAQMRRRLQKEAEEKKAAQAKARRIYRNRETGETYTEKPQSRREAAAGYGRDSDYDTRDRDRDSYRESRSQGRDPYREQRGQGRDSYRDRYDEDDRFPDEFDDERDDDGKLSDEPGGKKKSNALIWSLLVIFLLIFLFALYQLISIYREYKKGQNDYDNIREEAQQMLEEARKSEGKKGANGSNVTGDARPDETTAEETDEDGNVIKPLPNKERNRDWFKQMEFAYQGIVGWITIPDTVIDYPIMYSGDNEYYLTHTSVGTINSSGAIFLEATNNKDLNDYHTIVYGHNMKNGSMFAALRRYEYDPDFWKNHRYITVETPEGTLTYEIFSVQLTDAYSEVYTVGFWPGEVYAGFVQRLKNASMYDTGVSVSDQDYVLTLSTCTNNADGRTVVHAKRIPTP